MIFPKSVFPQVNPGEAGLSGPIPKVGEISPLGKQPDKTLPQAPTSVL